MALALSTHYVYRFIANDSYEEGLVVNWVILFVVSLAMAVALSVFTGLTVHQVLRNTTTIETYELSDARGNDRAVNPKKVNIFDLGSHMNWREVMGHGWVQWLVPLPLPRALAFDEDYDTQYLNQGLTFRVDRGALMQLERNAALQAQLDQTLRGISDERKAQAARALEEEFDRR